MYTIRILLGTLVATVTADGIITKFIVQMGLATEGNPFLDYSVTQDTFLILKLTGGLIAALYLWSIYRRHPRFSIGFTSLLLAGYTFIIFWNLSILL